MARQNNAIEVNRWVGGLITEASPLTYPENASIDELNFVLDVDGSRRRRLGMVIETTGAADIDTAIRSDTDVYVGVYLWKGLENDPSRNATVVQVGNKVYVLTTSATPTLRTTLTFTGVSNTTRIGITSVDGKLVLADGLGTIHIYSYDANSTVQQRITVRDLFGVQVLNGGVDFTSGDGVSIRPTGDSLSPGFDQTHYYNLRNQSWGIPRTVKLAGESSTRVRDPIQMFIQASASTSYTGRPNHRWWDNSVNLSTALSLFPSNADTVVSALYPDTSDSANRTKDKFHPEDLLDNLEGNSRVANGHFIIDLMNRGQSRIGNISEMVRKHPTLSGYVISNLATDSTSGGASVVAQYAGRVWFGGFSGTLTSGDSKSPNLASYVCFSQVVNDPSQITKCFQVADPTSKNDPDIVDTDGGFIRLNGAYGIKRMIEIGNGLMVFAANGVWYITNADQGFTATSYNVFKVSENGINGADSLVQVEDSIYYWGLNDIYRLARSDGGGFASQNISEATIKTFVRNISDEDRENCLGWYDRYSNTVRWVYDRQADDNDNTRELVLDVRLGAFYPNSLSRSTTGSDYKVVGGHAPLGDGDDESRYICVNRESSSYGVNYCRYKGSDFKDWGQTDAPAHMLTGYISGGDFQRKKGISSINVHCRGTERGFTLNDGDLDPINPSSCIMRVQWDWTDNINSGKWSRETEMYRRKRLNRITQPSNTYEGGFPVVSTKTSLRGSGKVLALHFRTRENHDLNLLGWSMIMGINTNVG